MSTELQSLVEQSEVELEHNLTAAMRGVSQKICARPDIQRSLAAAEQLRPGLVISTEAEAVAVADLVATVIDGEKVLTEERRRAERIPQQMVKAIRAVIAGPEAALAAARAVGNDARVAYQNVLRQRAREEQERLRKEAEAAAAEAARLAAESGEDEPPPLEIAPVEVPRTVAGGTGKTGTQIRMVPLGIEDWIVVPREWLQLVPEVARANFLAAERAGLVKKPEPGESVVWKGVRFVAKESAVNRR